MKARYSRVVVSEDTQKKMKKLKVFKEQFEKAKDDPNEYRRIKKEAIAYIGSISFKEMEVIGELLHNSLPEEFFNKEDRMIPSLT